MKIGIDARPLQAETRFRGIGMALESLLNALANDHSRLHSFVFYVDEGLPIPDTLERFQDKTIKRVRTSRLGRRRYIRSFLPSYPVLKPRKQDVDVILQYDCSLGVPKNVPSVVVFHDLIPILFREQEKKQSAKGIRRIKNSLAGHMYWSKYLRTFRYYKNATKIIAISQSSKRDLLDYLPNIKPSDAVTVYHGSEPQVKTQDTTSSLIKDIVSKDFLLYVGGIDLRKSIAELVSAFYSLKPRYPKLLLVAVGKEFLLEDQLHDNGWYLELNKNLDYAKDVITPGFVSHADLQALYSRAACFVFPTKYEGFGLPILEAMQAGCPVVAYSNSSIPEVAGDAALLVDDKISMVLGIRSLLDDVKLRENLVARGFAQASKFTWSKSAEETIKILESVVGR